MKIQDNLRGQLPKVDAPQPYRGQDGSRRGWKVAIPGQHPLATPALAHDRLFIGGGFGSYNFFCLDARDGNLLWQYQTEDDGPTAAVVIDDRVAFNTESCELEVLTLEGQRVWKKWLGDPLLSMPASADGRIYQAYPDSRGDRQHYLGCFDLETGHEYWRRPIPGEIITCPVIVGGEIFLTCLDGTVACLRREDGQVVWQDQRNATSSPAVHQGQCYYSQRHETQRHNQRQVVETLSSQFSMEGSACLAMPDSASMADYLDHGKRQARSPHYMAYAAHDAAVGFAGAKGDSKMHQAMHNLGSAHVAHVWAFQGSKPFLSRGRLYSSLGDTVHCADPATRDVHWKKKLRDGEEELLDAMVTPPAAVNGKLFVGTLDGRIVCLSAENGEVLWTENIGQPIAFQPAVMHGRVYAGTTNGWLYCLETGDTDDDGWAMWGGTAAHNGVAEEVLV